MLNLLAKVERLSVVASAIIIGIIMVTITAQLVLRPARVVFGGTVELASLLIVPVIYLGLAYVQSQGDHISVDLVVRRFPPGLRRWVDALSLLGTLVLFGLVTYAAGVTAYESWLRRYVMEGFIKFPLWPSLVCVPLSTALLCVRLLAQLLGLLFSEHNRG